MKYLALLIAFSASDSSAGMPTPATDWAFQEAQEVFVTESVGFNAAHATLPRYSRYLLIVMADSDWKRRDWASKTMREVGDVRACFLGQHVGDPEVKLRCRNVLRHLSSCSMCGGKGVSYQAWGDAECRVCCGVGHFWPPEDF